MHSLEGLRKQHFESGWFSSEKLFEAKVKTIVSNAKAAVNGLKQQELKLKELSERAEKQRKNALQQTLKA